MIPNILATLGALALFTLCLYLWWSRARVERERDEAVSSIAAAHKEIAYWFRATEEARAERDEARVMRDIHAAQAGWLHERLVKQGVVVPSPLGKGESGAHAPDPSHPAAPRKAGGGAAVPDTTRADGVPA